MNRILKYSLTYSILLFVFYIIWYIMNHSNKSLEHFNYANIDYRMSNQDARRLQKIPNNYGLISNNRFTPTGHQNPLKGNHFVSDKGRDTDLTVDCNKNSPTSLFLYSHNRCDPSCCGTGSSYSCDRGCICETDSQLKMKNPGCSLYNFKQPKYRMI